MKKIKIVSIDLQKDFSAEGGVYYRPRSSVEFIKSTLVPFLREKQIKIAEIVSDYRQPRPGDRGNCCRPGELGFQSEIPNDIKDLPVCIKCMNSPVWTRDNIGNKDKEPGIPYPDPKAFDKWVSEVIGKPEDVDVVLIGLTLDCCVLCATQEFCWRGYDVYVLNEGTDMSSGDQYEKNNFFKTRPFINWAEEILWSELQEKL